MKHTALLLALLAVTACDTSVTPAARRDAVAAPMSASEIANADEYSLCRHHGKSRQSEVFEAIRRQSQFTADELGQIQAGLVVLGARPAVVVCARGVPRNVSRTMDSRGESMTYHFGDGLVVTFTDGSVSRVTSVH